MGNYKGKNVDEAISNGLSELNLNKSEVKINIIDHGNAGVFGFFEKEAEVEITPLSPMELKIKSNNEKVISDVNQESEKLKNEVVKDADNAVNILLKKEEGYINNILNIDEARIDEVVKLLAERIVR